MKRQRNLFKVKLLIISIPLLFGLEGCNFVSQNIKYHKWRSDYKKEKKKQMELKKNEIIAYSKVKELKTVESCNNYLSSFPKGQYRNAVLALKEEIVFKKASLEDSKELYLTYLEEFGIDSKYFEEIKHRRPDLFWIADQNGIWINNPFPKKNERISWSGGQRNGKAHGFGKITWILNDRITSTQEGYLINGAFHGVVKCVTDGQVIEICQYKNGEADGYGKQWYIDRNGLRHPLYEGKFKRDKYHGFGTIYYTTGIYIGYFKDGKRDGPGVFIGEGGREKDIGYFKNDLLNGEAISFKKGKYTYYGQYKNSRSHGLGVIEGDNTYIQAFTYKYSSGESISCFKRFSGEWKNSVPWTGRFSCQTKGYRSILGLIQTYSDRFDCSIIHEIINGRRGTINPYGSEEQEKVIQAYTLQEKIKKNISNLELKCSNRLDKMKKLSLNHLEKYFDAARANTIESWRQFIKKYPDSLLYDDAILELYSLLKEREGSRLGKSTTIQLGLILKSVLSKARNAREYLYILKILEREYSSSTFTNFPRYRKILNNTFFLAKSIDDTKKLRTSVGFVIGGHSAKSFEYMVGKAFKNELLLKTKDTYHTLYNVSVEELYEVLIDKKVPENQFFSKTPKLHKHGYLPEKLPDGYVASGRIVVKEDLSALEVLVTGLQVTAKTLGTINMWVNELNPEPRKKSYYQGGDVFSNTPASSESEGEASMVCFYFNNSLELDIKPRLIIQHKQRQHLKTDTDGFFGSCCIHGVKLGGTYKFTYISNNKVKRGEFSISGNHKFVSVDLSDFFLEAKIRIHESD